MWDYFGPSPENLGAENNDYFNPSNIVSLGTEVGPYVPVIYPQMADYFAKIFNKLYARGRERFIEDLGIAGNLVPNIRLPTKLSPLTLNGNTISV